MFVTCLGFSQTINTGTIAPTSYCEGEAVNVTYTITGTFNSANTFTAQLSDALGSFISPIEIGTLGSNSSGTITATIPSGTASGSGYRIRVVSNDPAIIGSGNGSDLTVLDIPTAPVIGTIIHSCDSNLGSVDLSGLPIGAWEITEILNGSPSGRTFSGLGSTTTITGLSPGTYTYTVKNSIEGLEGEYFNNLTLADPSVLTRTDQTIDFDWGGGSPDASVNTNHFSVRWTGNVVPSVSDDYVFRTRTDDGVRLWVDGVPVINDWTTHSPTYNYSAAITLNAGQKYSIVLEYYENAGEAVVELDWNRAGAATYVNIPSSQLVRDGINGCSSLPSADVVIESRSGSPGAPTTTNASLCVGGTANVTLSASGASSGDRYRWYDAATGGAVLKTSTDDSDNTFITPAINTPTNYWVAILDSGGCQSDLTMVSAVTPNNPLDSQTTSGTDSWIGHVYDGNNASVLYDGSFTDYYGTVTEPEEFDQGFGGSYTCYPINSATEGNRSIYTQYFSVRYRMNSSRRGLYVVDIGSDDGTRLQVDGTLAYNYWANRGYVVDQDILISLNGSSSLIFDFYENSGGNRVSFNDLTQIIENNLDTNTIQTICETGVGVPISGDEFGAMPSGISGSGYQWAYGSSSSGPWDDISGATGATYTPDALDFVGVSDGDIVYVIRKATLTSVNNRINPYVAEHISNATTINITDTNVWTGAVDTDWNDTGNWSCGAVPEIITDVLIPASATNQPEIFSGDASGLTNDFNIETGASLTVYDNVIETDGILLLNGVIDLVDEGQLLQNDASTVNPVSTGYLERDQQGKANSFNYNYWSSPVHVSGASTYNLDTVLKDGRSGYYGGDIMYSTSAYGADTAPVGQLIKSSRWLYTFDGPTDDYNAWNKIDQNTNLNPGQGFTMKGSMGAVPLTDLENYVFIGMPNNGLINININPGDDVLIGNPYPSALDAHQFIRDQIASTINNSNAGNNSSNVINGALYFWDHFGEVNSHVLKQYVGGYATRNLVGGTIAISNDPLINNNDADGTKVPGQYIPVGQGFFVSATLDADLDPDASTTDVVGGTIQFKNSQRVFVTESSGNSVFLKSAQKVGENKTVEDTRPKIRLTYASNGYFRQLLIGADPNTSNNFDIGYDAPMLDAGDDDMFWDINQGKFVIQGVPEFDEDAQFPLGLHVSANEMVEIQVTDLVNIPEDTDLYIKDSFTNKTYPINDAAFKMNLEAGAHLNRFSLVFKAENTLGTEQENLEHGLSVFMLNASDELQIKNTTSSSLLAIKMYNVLGGVVNAWTDNLEASVSLLPVGSLASGVYFVQLETISGSTIKKVVVE
ncbi:PA14 domain-containing protein [Tamlana sp. 2_MG-2023]|uniref:PA14 domain-containing protein n=1 Tax=unclassified Tamlana TaxID=2614803 RepID=UPI0026E18418|nr:MULTISPECIES: PA14 domain-containing protein [unclassified Tamlana]MDO6761790.1 PA14 domain-containing protein [Tamlana sp. 2_MG-2023]MDO6792551.1 PA14 domain-containing protein [Tamlana sp. 1_MG-2023]